MALNPTRGEPRSGMFSRVDPLTGTFNHAPVPLSRNVELTPSTEMMRERIVEITANSALAAHFTIQDAYSQGNLDIARLKINIDHAATDVFEEMLKSSDFLTYVYCEGDKEGAKDPNAAVRTLRGLYGPDVLRGDETEIIVGGVIDPVEGTKPASRNEVSSTSVFVGSRGGVVRKIPGEDQARYFNRIAGPARLRGKISVTKAPQDNIIEVAQAYGVSVQEVEAVVLERPKRNQPLVDALTEMGVKLTLIQDGDFMPGYMAVKSDKPFISYGSGGKEEGFALGMLAKKHGGAFDGQLVGEFGEFLPDFPEILNPDDIVSGEPTDIFVSVSSITGEKYFGLDPITQEVGPDGQIAYLVDTISEDGNGFRREKIVVKKPQEKAEGGRSIIPDETKVEGRTRVEFAIRDPRDGEVAGGPIHEVRVVTRNGETLLYLSERVWEQGIRHLLQTMP